MESDLVICLTADFLPSWSCNIPERRCYGSPAFLEVSAFSQVREVLGRLLSASVGSHLSPVQNNSYAEMAYFGVAYSDFLHCISSTLQWMLQWMFCFWSWISQTLHSLHSIPSSNIFKTLLLKLALLYPVVAIYTTSWGFCISMRIRHNIAFLWKQDSFHSHLPPATISFFSFYR